jgi:hypothetical protein
MRQASGVRKLRLAERLVGRDAVDDLEAKEEITVIQVQRYSSTPQLVKCMLAGYRQLTAPLSSPARKARQVMVSGKARHDCPVIRYTTVAHAPRTRLQIDPFAHPCWRTANARRSSADRHLEPKIPLSPELLSNKKSVD